ncbi:beta-ketoacyl-ACP synthase 3 [Pontiella sulfatireligans]|uniref:3-methyl-2-oxobutanoate dehydrogenase (2-methylpropanoyl-transferring) n=1 Tax=Pontiella sulfatireligans TaxID=2750658 RepID=A0A6C2UM71_9BACT|nr:beta-ketoacyl-ACP synthase 3 [Pontiella sulfatireligans]VGO21089.1 2-oxoisovalerate dehydrogenase subunit beta [Pontiella sulfatireligans]
MNAPSAKTLLEIYRPMVASRYTDQLQSAAAQRGEVFFYIPSSGHEASAALAPHLIEADWLHLHYRDRALAYARGVSYKTVFYGLFSKAESNSAGRRMPAFPCDPALNIMSTPTLVGNNVLQAVGAAATIKNNDGAPFVLVSIGDGATQQGDFYEAVAEAVRSNLPVLFLVEDNRFALSTVTKGNTFYSLPEGEAETFYGLPIQRVDGSDTAATYSTFEGVVSKLRETRGPQIVVLNVERLESHTNADDQSAYRTEADLKNATENADPCAKLHDYMLANGVDAAAVKAVEDEVKEQVDAAFHTARKGTTPKPVFDAKKPLPEQREEYLGTADNRSLSMLEAMRETLKARLAKDSKTTLLGQDIEDPKGDVFGLTRGLSQAFPEQVSNAALAESTILGISTGQALAGGRPVAFMQFSDFLPVAYNHILSEIGAMHWRTNGQWESPVLIMSIAGAYRPGLGPYHAQTMESICAHVPGVDVFMPSTAADAAGLLNAIAESGRPSVFLFPKSLINDRSNTTSTDVEQQYVPIGKARIARAGQDITLVSWGGAMPVCERTAEALAEVGINAEVIDLRTIFPWDEEAVLASAKKTGKLIVVHEDNQTAGMGGEIVAAIAEKAGDAVQFARVTRPDTYIPYDFSCQIEVMPSYKRTLEKCCEMLEVSIHWNKPVEEEAGTVIVKAIGSSPSDETITVANLLVSKGDAIAEGDLIASVEADKASMDISSPVSGTIAELLIEEGDVLTVGTPMVKIASDEAAQLKPLTKEEPGIPIMKRRRITEAVEVVQPSGPCEHKPIYISNITTVFGSRHLTNDELLQGHGEWDSDAIRKRTGIENRYWIAGDESVLTLAVDATKQLLEKENLQISDIGAIICSSGTPLAMTPSLACSVLHKLNPTKGEVAMQAHDVNAACSGYMYGLQSAFDFLTNAPEKKVIVITAETLSPMVNHDDQKTMALFGDAATASLISCEQRPGNICAKLNRPFLSATGVDSKVLYVPNMGSGEVIEMEGLTVFKLAVRKMIEMLDNACKERGIIVEDLDMIVPHQANERIIEAIRKTIKCPPEKMFNHIRKYGNTSSNTIPIALTELMPETNPDALVGLTAFGGGFTFGAAVIEKV